MDTLGIDATAEEVDLMLSEIDIGISINITELYLIRHAYDCVFSLYGTCNLSRW